VFPAITCEWLASSPFDEKPHHFIQLQTAFLPLPQLILILVGLASIVSYSWDRHTRDKVDSFGLAFNMLSSNQKWQFQRQLRPLIGPPADHNHQPLSSRANCIPN
jgi:hypothetical protein